MTAERSDDMVGPRSQVGLTEDDDGKVELGMMILTRING